MEFHDFEVFVVVTKEKSFSRAAKRLFRTQPAISLSIRRIEDEIGWPVFDRSTKEPTLTDVGRVLFDYSEKLLNLRNQIKPKIEEIKNVEIGKIRIGANEIGALFLLPHIVEYRKQHPGVRIEVIRCRSKDIPFDIQNRALDLGIVAFDIDQPDLASTVVYEDYLALVVYPSHPLAKQKQVPLKKLSDEVFAAHNVDSKFRERILQTFQRNKIALSIAVELPTIESIKKFVQMEQALALVPKICIQSELKRKELIEVRVPEIETMHKNLRVVSLKGDGPSFAAKSFIRLLTTAEP